MGVRSSYLRAVGLTAEEGVTGGLRPFTAEEEEQFRRLAASPDIYDRIAKSIAPSVFGAIDMKKAIACLLFGGKSFVTSKLCHIPRSIKSISIKL